MNKLYYIAYLTSKISGLGFKYILILYLSSFLLTAKDFGDFSIYLVVLNFTYLFSSFGITETVQYLTAKSDINARKIYSALIHLLVIPSVLYFTILYFVLRYLAFDHPILLSFFSVGFFISIFIKKLGIGLSNKKIMTFFESSIQLLILVTVILTAKDVNDVLILYSLYYFIISVITLIFLKPHIFISISVYRECLINIKKYGFSVHLSQFMAMGTYDLDKVILKLFHNSSSVGIYNLILNFIMPVKIFSQSISEFLFRNFSSRKEINKVIYFNFIISIVMSLSLTIFAYFLLNNFYDSSYNEIYNLLVYLPVLGIMSSYYVPINMFFSANGYVKEKMINAVILSIANIVFNFLLIPLYGVGGAVIATILALSINNISFHIQYRKKIKDE